MKERAPSVWLAAAALLLGFPIRSWIREAPPGFFVAPVTPLDRSDAHTARQWLFLRQARSAVPPGATYTVVAPEPEVEMNLYMMSLGLLPEARGFPSSYYGIPTAEAGALARYVLAYGNPPIPGEVRLRAAFLEGQVYERPDRR